MYTFQLNGFKLRENRRFRENYTTYSKKLFFVLNMPLVTTCIR